MQQDLKSILTQFFVQVETGDHSTSRFPHYYDGLVLKPGFGFGMDAKIPWICFLGNNQTPQDGFFPVYYFFKEHHKLILAKGVSETKMPVYKWQVTPEMQTIQRYFQPFGIKPHKYGLSHVYKVYNILLELNYAKMEEDLHSLLTEYKQRLKLFHLA